MTAVVFLICTLLFCYVHSQLFGPGPQFPIPQGLNIPTGPSNAGPNTLDIIAPSGPINIISNQNTPNSKTVLNSAQNYGPSSQSVIPFSNPNLSSNNQANNLQFFNTAPSFIQNPQPSCLNTSPINQIPLINLPNPQINQYYQLPTPTNFNIQTCSNNQLPLINIPNPPINQIPSAINLPSCGINQLPPAVNLPNSVINPTCFNPVQPQTIINTSPPILPNIPQIAPSIVGNCAPTCNSQPAVTTVIDNTLANSLANALQLLIVSDLIENTLGGSTNYGSTNFIPSGPCVSNFEIVTPDFTSPITYEVPIVSYECPVVSCPDPVCSIPDPVCVIPEPVCSIPDPVCIIPDPVYSIPEPVYSIPDPIFSIPDQTCSIPEFVYTVPEPVYQTQTPCIDYSSNSIPTFAVIDSACQNQIPFAYDTPTSFVPQFMPTNVPSDIPAIASVPPMALEIPFPSSIPAQLICNFGYLPSNQPCVSFDVEPLPYGTPLFSSFGL